jgi:hypothetical protein
MAQEVQTLDARYIDGATLLALLKNLFGRGNFSIDVCAAEIASHFMLTLVEAC